MDFFDLAVVSCDVCGRPVPASRHQRRAEGGVCSYLCQRIDQRARIYGITGRDCLQLLKRQGGLCAICGCSLLDEGGWRINIDHDHRTGRVRGILCRRCNLGLGLFNDDPSRLARAAEYVRRPFDEVPNTVAAGPGEQ
jgi:hypothetical protein